MSPNRHQRRALAKRDALHQVFVETRKGRVLAIGPKTGRQPCEMLVVAINKAIIDGTETLWSNPHIVSVPAKL